MCRGTCKICGETATFFFSDPADPENQVSLCAKHARADERTGVFASGVPSRADVIDVMMELRDLVTRDGSLPIDAATLPSGRRNPIHGRSDLCGMSAEEFLDMTNEINHVDWE